MKIEEMISTRRADCTGCETCANICPKNCISMQRDEEGFAYPKINHEICISCGKCDKICPVLNFKPVMPDKLPEVFVAIHPDEKIRRHSSSGGTFTALSELILNTGGIIFGAGFDENWHVVHTSAENFNELENLRGSKYVQSQIGDVYKRVKIELEKGRRVLFSGTPCQCAGLKNFLGKDYDNLLTVDIICHGVPSPKLWESYIEYRAQGHDIARVNFRSKRHGWMGLHLELNFYDCGYYDGFEQTDLYFKEFLNDLILRPSCHECKFKFPNGKADITIGDAWGVQNFAPKFFDNRGTSLVIVHTDKGKNFLSKANLIKQAVSFDVLPMNNPAYLNSVIPDARRADFFNDLKNFPNLPIAVMQKYFYQNPNKVDKSGRNLNQETLQKYSEILRHISKLREKNLLFITPMLDNETINKIPRDKDSGFYILQLTSENQATLIDRLHPFMKFGIDNFKNLRWLIKSFHITKIFIDIKINFGADGIKFLEDSGVKVETLTLK